MASYECSVITPAAATGAAYAAIRCASTDRARIREIGITVNAATASSIGLIRPATVGTASTSTLVQACEPGDPAGTTNVDTAWSSAPTISTNVFLRRFVAGAVIGNGVIWQWPADAPLVVSASNSVLLWNFGAGTASACSLYVKIDE